MRETTKPALFPLVSVRGQVPKEINQDKVEIELYVEFAGVKKHYSRIPFQFVQNGDLLNVSGQIELSLKYYGIKAPALLGVSIDDKVPLKIKTQWKKGS